MTGWCYHVTVFISPLCVHVFYKSNLGKYFQTLIYMNSEYLEIVICDNSYKSTL